MKNRTDGGVVASLALVVTALLWGGMIPMTHALANNFFDPFFLAAMRYMLPAPLLLSLCLLLDRASPFRGMIPWRHLAGLGAAMACFSICYTIGIMNTEPVRAAIVMSCNPLIAALLSKILSRTPLARGFWPAAICAVVGAALVAVDAVRPNAASGGQVYWLGDILLLFAMACWAWYSMKAQQWLVPLGWSQMRITFLTSLAGSVIIVSGVVALVVSTPGHLPTVMPTPAALFMLAWVGLGGAGFAIYLWNFGVSRIGVPQATLFGSLAPVFSVLVAALFFGSHVTLQQIAGGILILAGVVRMQWLQMQGLRAQKMV